MANGHEGYTREDWDRHDAELRRRSRLEDIRRDIRHDSRVSHMICPCYDCRVASGRERSR